MCRDEGRRAIRRRRFYLPASVVARPTFRMFIPVLNVKIERIISNSTRTRNRGMVTKSGDTIVEISVCQTRLPCLPPPDRDPRTFRTR